MFCLPLLCITIISSFVHAFHESTHFNSLSRFALLFVWFLSARAHAQDIFSLGLVLFEVLTGSPLFCSDAEAAAVYRDLSAPALRRKAGAVFIEHCVRRRLNELCVTDRTLRDFLYRALQFAPHLRPTAARMAQHPLLPRV